MRYAPSDRPDLCLQVQTGDESTVVEHRRFAAVCWGPGSPATTMVMLNEHGQLVDVLYAGQLSGGIRRTRRNAQGVDDIFSDPAKVGSPAASRGAPSETRWSLLRRTGDTAKILNLLACPKVVFSSPEQIVTVCHKNFQG